MKLYAPKYYNEFVCIADKCSHSCCIGWEIDVDDIALCKYRSSSHSYAKQIISSISFEEAPHFRLNTGDRCPHLNSKGLCEIILNLGEDYLCDICREHPRFYNYTNYGKEVGLGMSCEEACRVILSSDDYGVFVEIGETCGEIEKMDFDALSCREKVYSVLSDTSLSYNEKLSTISAGYNVSPTEIPDSTWRKILSSLEYLDPAHKPLFAVYSSDAYTQPRYEKYLERALAYFVFRHCSEAQDEYEFRASLGFCLFCERLLASLLVYEKSDSFDDVIRLARTVSEEIEYSEDNTDAIRLEFSV